VLNEQNPRTSHGTRWFEAQVEHILSERNILLQIDHPFIVNMASTFQGKAWEKKVTLNYYGMAASAQIVAQALLCRFCLIISCVGIRLRWGIFHSPATESHA